MRAAERASRRRRQLHSGGSGTAFCDCSDRRVDTVSGLLKDTGVVVAVRRHGVTVGKVLRGGEHRDTSTAEDLARRRVSAVHRPDEAGVIRDSGVNTIVGRNDGTIANCQLYTFQPQGKVLLTCTQC